LQPQVQSDKPGTIAKTDAAERESQERGQEQSKNEYDYSKASPAPSITSTNTVGPRRVGGLVAESKVGSRSDVKDKKVARDEDESRNVSGRYFRRRGNTWVDSAYDPQQSTINVARGSEHFRSLVADEPGIGAIAGQLTGEVIVVWKGKAYRIH
jgi:hypothetical protein